MLKRIYHALFVGHAWTTTTVFSPPTCPGRMLLSVKSDYHEAYGFTTVREQCKCGATRRLVLVGDWSCSRTTAEIEELRRMFSQEFSQEG